MTAVVESDDGEVVSQPRSTVRSIGGLVRAILMIVVLLAAGFSLFRHWSEIRDTVFNIGWQIWIPAFLVLIPAILCSTMSWQLLVDELGEPIGAKRGGQIFLVGQLGKYLPGSIWAYVLQLELGRRAGLSRARVFTATVFSLAVIVVAALLAASLAIPMIVEQNPDLSNLIWLYFLLPFGVVALHPAILTRLVSIGFRLLRKPDANLSIRLLPILLSLAWALAAYAFFGVHMWILAEGAGDVDLAELPLFIGTMAAAMVAGLFFFVLPSGAGVRELVIVTTLSSVIGTGPAIGIAAVSRVFLTLADLVTAGGAAGLAVWAKRATLPSQSPDL